MKTAYIALGANLGNPKESLRKAAEKIKDLDGVASVEASGLYSTAPIELPHPRMTERAFVLVPLVEVDSSVEISGKGKAVEFLDSVKDQSIIKLFEARDWL